MSCEAGLDTQHRPQLSKLLKELHSSISPRIIMALRPQDPIPEWVSHILTIKQHGEVDMGTIEKMRSALVQLRDIANYKTGKAIPFINDVEPREEFVSMKNVNVSYHERHVSLRW